MHHVLGFFGVAALLGAPVAGLGLAVLSLSTALATAAILAALGLALIGLSELLQRQRAQTDRLDQLAARVERLAKGND